MWSRREIVLGGAAVLLWEPGPSGLCSPQSSRQRHNPTYGCWLPHTETGQFFATASESRLYVTGDEPMIPQSGDREFDYALAQTLAKISDTFDVAPGFAYYDDYDVPNAYATDESRPISYGANRYKGADGTVLFGKSLLQLCLEGNDHPELSVACICAHEFGHILQYKRGLAEQIGAGQKTRKRVELHADFLAGYFGGVRKLERPSFPAAVFAVTQYTWGDNDIHSPQHHGTHEERAAAIVRGFEVAFKERRSLSEAIQISIEYAETL